MKDLYQCKECGFLSTCYPGFINVNGELLCEYCAKENHGVVRSSNLKSHNSDYIKDVNFWKRLLMFVSDVQVSDLMGEEEKEMIIDVCNHKIEEVEG